MRSLPELSVNCVFGIFLFASEFKAYLKMKQNRNFQIVFFSYYFNTYFITLFFLFFNPVIVFYLYFSVWHSLSVFVSIHSGIHLTIYLCVCLSLSVCVCVCVCYGYVCLWAFLSFPLSFYLFVLFFPDSNVSLLSVLRHASSLEMHPKYRHRQELVPRHPRQQPQLRPHVLEQVKSC